MNMERYWNDHNRGNASKQEKILSSATQPYKNPACSGMESNAGLCGKRPRPGA